MRAAAKVRRRHLPSLGPTSSIVSLDPVERGAPEVWIADQPDLRSRAEKRQHGGLSPWRWPGNEPRAKPSTEYSAGGLAHAYGLFSGHRVCRSAMSSMVCARASYVSATFGLLCSSPLMGNEEASPSYRVLARACTRHRGAQALAPRYGARLTLPVFPSFSAFSSIHL